MKMIARVCVSILLAAIASHGDKLAKTALAYSNIDLAFEQYTLTISDSVTPRRCNKLRKREEPLFGLSVISTLRHPGT